MAKSKAQQAAEAKEAAQEALKLVEQEAKLRERMNSGYDEYIKAVREAHALQETLLANKKIEEGVRKKIKAIEDGILKVSDEELAAEKEKLKILEKQNKLIGKQVDLYKQAAKEANIGAMALGKSLKGIKDVAMSLPGLVKGAFGQIKGLGIFEMDKAMKQTALSMGVLSKESGGMRTTITNVAKQTTMIGVNLAKVAKLQEDYSANLGRNVLLNEKGLKAMAQMSVVTGLGAEGTAQMAADMDVVGLSAERTGEFVNQTLKSSHKMGVNSTKVMKNLAGNFKMLNKYHFKDGVRGLAKMAQLVTRLGVDMETASGFADKLWNVEGAVEMSAQLNVMGGAWAKMADPFHLMYMARNDMAGLTEEIANAAKESVSFNATTGEFDMSTEGMHKLKIIAEQTGLAYEDLVKMGKNAKKFEKIESQINFSVGGGEEGKAMKDFITSKSMMNKKGEATIMLDGKERLVKSLTEADKTLIKAKIAQEEDMQKRAEQSRTFDEQLTYFIDQLKVYLLPMLEGINKMMPKLDGLVDKFNAKGGWGEKIEAFAKTIGDLIGAVGGWIIEHPKLTAAIIGFTKAMPLIMGGIKLLGGIWDTIKWFKNGIALGEGFNTVASAGGGGGSGMDMDIGGLTGKGGRFRNMKAAWKMAGRGGKGFMGKAFSAAKGFMGKTGMANGQAIGRTASTASKATKGLGMLGKTGNILGKGARLTGNLLGKAAPFLNVAGVLKDQFDFFADEKTRSTGAAGWLESLGGSGMSLIDWIPGVNQLTEAIGLGINNMETDNLANARAIYRSNHPKAPTIIPNATLINDIRKNPQKYNSEIVEDIEDVTPQDVQDGIAKPGRGPFTITDKFGKMAKTHAKDGLEVGPHVGGSSVGGKVKHEFGDINISGTIRLETPGNSLSVEIANNQSFRRQITRMVQEEAVKQMGMGKPKG